MRRTALLILGAAGGLVALLLIAVAIVVATVDPNRFVAPLATRVKAETGRTLAIGGPVDFSVSLEPKIVLPDVSFGNARIKVLGSDVGNFEREEWVESIVVAPAERYIVHVRFDEPGRIAIENRVTPIEHTFGQFYEQIDTLGYVLVEDPPDRGLVGPPKAEERGGHGSVASSLVGTVRMDHLSVVVDDLDAAIALFAELGLELEGRMPVSGPAVDAVNGLAGVDVEIAMLRAPDESGKLEVTQFRSPAAEHGSPAEAPPNLSSAVVRRSQ